MPLIPLVNDIDIEHDIGDTKLLVSILQEMKYLI